MAKLGVCDAGRRREPRSRILGRVGDLAQRVGERIAAMRPYLDRSGGRVELVNVEDSVARIRVWLTRPGPSRLIDSLQLKSGVERALRHDVPELRAVEAINLPPYAELGWDQPDFRPIELPVASDGGAAAVSGSPATPGAVEHKSTESRATS